MNYNEAKEQAINDRWRFLKLKQGTRTLTGFTLLKNGGIQWDKLDGAVMRNSPGTFQFECFENMKDQTPRIINFVEGEKWQRTARTPEPNRPEMLSDGISPAMVTKLMELERVKVELIQKTAQCDQQTKLIKSLNDKIEELEIELSQVELEDEPLDDGGTIWTQLAQSLAPHVIAAAPGLLDGLINKLKPQQQNPQNNQQQNAQKSANNNGRANPIFYPKYEAETASDRNENTASNVEYFE
jgi:hypothetical protein